ERSLAVGAVVGLVGLALAWVIVAPSAPKRGRVRPTRWGGSTSRLVVETIEAVPPLAIAAGALLVPTLLGPLADGWPAGEPSLAAAVHGFAAQIDPFAAPGMLLVLVLLAAHLPALVRAADLGLEGAEPVLGDAARSLGASRRRAWRALAGIWLGSTPLAA